MKKPSFRIPRQFWLAVILAAALPIVLIHTRSTRAQGTIPPAPPGLEKIQHLVFIMQENRSFDSYFGTYPGGVDGIPPDHNCLTAPQYKAGCVAPHYDSNDQNRGGPHMWQHAHGDVDKGLMDG